MYKCSRVLGQAQGKAVCHLHPFSLCEPSPGRHSACRFTPLLHVGPPACLTLGGPLNSWVVTKCTYCPSLSPDQQTKAWRAPAESSSPRMRMGPCTAPPCGHRGIMVLLHPSIFTPPSWEDWQLLCDPHQLKQQHYLPRELSHKSHRHLDSFLNHTAHIPSPSVQFSSVQLLSRVRLYVTP